MTLVTNTCPKLLKRAFAALLACGLLASATPVVTDAAAASKKSTTTSGTFGADGRKN
jgi:hypothetical protein